MSKFKFEISGPFSYQYAGRHSYTISILSALSGHTNTVWHFLSFRKSVQFLFKAVL